MTEFTNKVKWYLANPSYINKNYQAAAKVVAKIDWEPSDWPLPEGHIFYMNNGDPKARWGKYAAERVHIKRIQQRLISGGHVPGITNVSSGWADGIYGRETADAVRRFKTRAGMNPGGGVGPGTWARMGI